MSEDDKGIEIIMKKAGNRNRYQYILTILGILCWINQNFLGISVGHFEKLPEVEYFKDGDPTKEKIHDTLNYDICKFDYNVTETFDYSIVIQTGIECNQLKTGLLGASIFSGCFFSSIIFDKIADNIGRKNTILYGDLLFAFDNVIMIFFVKNYWPLFILIFLQSFLCIFPLSGFLITVEEVTDEKLKGLFNMIITMGETLACLLYFPLFKFYGKLKYIFLITAIYAFIIFILVFFLTYESPRYYMLKKDKEKFYETIKKISMFNKRLIIYEEFSKTEEFGHLVPMIDDDKKEEEKEEKEKSVNINYCSLLKFKSIRYKFLIMCFVSFVVATIYNSLAVEIKNLPGDIFTNAMIMYLADSAFVIINGFIINTKLGRRGTYIMLLIIVIVCFGFLSFMKLTKLFDIIFSIIVRVGVSSLLSISYVFFVELYPTPLRSMGFSLNSCFEHIGGSVIPIVQEYLTRKQLSLVLGICCIICLVLLYFIPETRGIPTQDQIEELMNHDLDNTDDHTKSENKNTKVSDNSIIDEEIPSKLYNESSFDDKIITKQVEENNKN